MSDPSILIFPQATDNTLEGNTFNIHHVETNIHSANEAPCPHTFERFLKHCCLGAQVDSNERFDPPRCDPETRLKITQEIMDWINSDDEIASIMVLHGKKDDLRPPFFLSRSAASPQRSDGDAVIPTLVYQHLQVFPWLKERVLEDISKDPGLFARSREVQFDRLFVKYFQALPQQLPGDAQHRLIALDGLDECSDRSVQQDLLRIIAAAVPRLRHPFRFFFACRPEVHLMQVVNNDRLFQHPFVHRIDLNAIEVDEDIRLFIIKEFWKIHATHPLREFLPKDWPPQSIITTLVTKASQQFIYADVVMRFVSRNNARPEDQLNDILAVAPPRQDENPFSNLDALYSYIFDCVQDRETVQRILGIIWLASQNKAYSVGHSYSDPAQLEEILGCRRGDIHLALADLLSVISVSKGRGVKVLHTSLFDFLLNPTRSGAHALDLALAHQSLATWLWRKTISRGV
ncbi:hypothetical protein NLJ89_g3895 [Agrocybe chaxingu]|uniref:Nephrocystin 3-like N-terminal domain-containing protein n=1 Tax=Agrocybe chaxingu TaxID=84603 RepID=A0A9W8MX04_9AGAR|nr:hypothetical protein NLJ89_g3895 [Agrocybe chaxingu]